MNIISPTKPKASISLAEMQRRREALERADAHNRIEGLYPNPAATEVYEEFIRGDIDFSEIWPRIKVLQTRF